MGDNLTKLELISAIAHMQTAIGNRIDGDCNKEETEFLHEMWEWMQNILAEVIP